MQAALKHWKCGKNLIKIIQATIVFVSSSLVFFFFAFFLVTNDREHYRHHLAEGGIRFYIVIYLTVYSIKYSVLIRDIYNFYIVDEDCKNNTHGIMW